MLTDKYRPKKWKEVRSNKEQISVLKNAVSSRGMHVFFIEGPAGIGKTSLARIAAASLGAGPDDITEVNGAIDNGAEYWRELVVAVSRYRPMSGNVRVVICDEAHCLTKASFDSLLKDTEEPPEHLYWFFCSTKTITDISKTIQTRVVSIKLRAASNTEVRDLVDFVCEKENIELSDSLKNTIVDTSTGCFRIALNRIDSILGLTEQEALSYLESSGGEDASLSDDMRELMKFLQSPSKGLTMREAGRILGKLNDSPESLRLKILSWCSTSILSRSPKDSWKTDSFFEDMADIIEAFMDTYPNTTKMAPIISCIRKLSRIRSGKSK